MGGRGSTGGGTLGAITTGERDLNFQRVGASFSKLSPFLQNSINSNLKMSNIMKKDILNGRKHKTTDEWTTGIGNKKIKVITDVVEGKVVYTIKERNKNLSKNVSKEQAANKVAQFYLGFNK